MKLVKLLVGAVALAAAVRAFNAWRRDRLEDQRFGAWLDHVEREVASITPEQHQTGIDRVLERAGLARLPDGQIVPRSS